MSTIAILLVMVVSFGAIAWPFLGRRTRSEEGPKSERPWDDLVSQRDTAYQALKELEFEYSLGNLSDADYADLRERYRVQAAGILQRLDTAMEHAEPQEADTGMPVPPSGIGCASCGGAVEAEDAYCWHCGAALSEFCQNCGEPVLEEDRFCAGCGQRLEVEV